MTVSFNMRSCESLRAYLGLDIERYSYLLGVSRSAYYGYLHGKFPCGQFIQNFYALAFRVFGSNVIRTLNFFEISKEDAEVLSTFNVPLLDKGHVVDIS